jgi:hypothetical protein
MTKKNEPMINSYNIVEQYNKLNNIININEYPWNLREKKFILTYKNINLYYKNLVKKNKKGGATKILVFLF